MLSIPVEAFDRNLRDLHRCPSELGWAARQSDRDPVDRATFAIEMLQGQLERNPSRDEVDAFAEYVGYERCKAFWGEIERLTSAPYEPPRVYEPYQRFTGEELTKMTRALAQRARTKPRDWVCGHGQLHQHRRSTDRYRCVFVFCHLWKCARCAAWLKRRWTAHAADRIRSVGQVYVIASSREVWDKQYRSAEGRKRGVGGGYLRVNLPGVPDVAEVVVFTTAPIGEAFSAEAAVELATKMIELSPSEKKAVTSSRSWKLPKREDVHEWKRIGRIATTINQAAAIVSEFSLRPSMNFGVGQDATAFEFRLDRDMVAGTEGFEVLRKALDVGVAPTVVDPVPKEPVGA